MRAALADVRPTKSARLYPRFSTMCVYISEIRGSTPELPPVVSSMRRPCNFTFSGQQTSSVATAWIAPWLVAAHNAS